MIGVSLMARSVRSSRRRSVRPHKHMYLIWKDYCTCIILILLMKHDDMLRIAFVHFHVINFRPQIVFGVLLLSAVYGQESKSDVKLEMGKLAESIRGSALLRQGLTGTVASSIDKKLNS